MDLTAGVVLLFMMVTVGLRAQTEPRLVCYMNSWAQYRLDASRFTPDKVDPFLCTHVIYAFLDINENHEINPLSEEHCTSLRFLKKRNPELKILLAVGGVDSDNNKFIEISSNHTLLQTFVHSAWRYLRLKGFDGLDVVWQNPGSFTGSLGSKALFTSLMKELREGATAEARVSGEEPLILSTAVSGLENYALAAYNTHTFHRYVDFITLMTYDFHGPWQGMTGHISPLFGRPHQSEDQLLSMEQSVEYWLSQEVEPRKLTLGFPAYSRTFQILGNRTRHEVGEKAAEGQAGLYTQTPGFMAFYEVCQFVQNGAVIKFDKQQKVPYAYKDGQWLSFDNEQSLKEKTAWLKSQGLGGAMLWALDLDDFSGTLCHDGTFPLTRLLRSSLLLQHGDPEVGDKSTQHSDHQYIPHHGGHHGHRHCHHHRRHHGHYHGGHHCHHHGHHPHHHGHHHHHHHRRRHHGHHHHGGPH